MRSSNLQTTTQNQLMTGATYFESLKDGREIWYDGEKVADVVEHPAFRNAARSIARLYDALHDPDLQDDLTTIDKFGQRTHCFFAPSYSVGDLNRSRRAIEIWRRINYGWMGRSPDYKFSGPRADQAVQPRLGCAFF